jgi:subtilisin family serine protease
MKKFLMMLLLLKEVFGINNGILKESTNNGKSYELGTGSHDVVVGIIDTGIDRDHPDLINNLLPGSKNFVSKGGYQGTESEETGNPDAFDDKDGHGSHVAGSIAGNGEMLGVAPNLGIKAYRVFGKSSAETAWVVSAIILPLMTMLMLFE